MKIFGKLQSLVKNGMFISDYILKTKIILDHLAVVWEIIPKWEMVLYILNSLGPNYFTFVATFNMTQVRPFVGILHNQLQNFEKMLLASERAIQESIF